MSEIKTYAIYRGRYKLGHVEASPLRDAENKAISKHGKGVQARLR